MDDIDKAQDLETYFRQMAIKSALGETVNKKTINKKGKRLCLDCYEPIPLKRLQANPGAVRCLDCQMEAEGR